MRQTAPSSICKKAASRFWQVCLVGLKRSADPAFANYNQQTMPLICSVPLFATRSDCAKARSQVTVNPVTFRKGSVMQFEELKPEQLEACKALKPSPEAPSYFDLLRALGNLLDGFSAETSPLSHTQALSCTHTLSL